MTTKNRIAELRDAAGLTRTDLASQLGVTERTIYRWEGGEVMIPDLQKLALAQRFGVAVVWLMGWEKLEGAPAAT